MCSEDGAGVAVVAPESDEDGDGMFAFPVFCRVKEG